ncbi:MAG: hypothetical protein K6T81_13340 [Alicyclobacillus macrosporangiidus]|uniref:PspA/IM30 family protein n=1 Tax=Alicyclobacillus macrosporangiidus TaxID=392015 RepID=UPI0026E9A601|nr:hypothetical protein [Alicyclobacillus macrosporangiidus]MCL6599705.1 hypothetical protein [Alicyclobacillus macrosporangiidus]
MIPKTIDEYVWEVLKYIPANAATKRRIERDLTIHLSERAEVEGLALMLHSLGSPEETAREFADNLEEQPNNIAQEISRLRQDLETLSEPYYEYKSATTLFGLPLVHIKHRRRWGAHGHSMARVGVAKGIIAIGDVAIGVISIGVIALGGFCLGALSLGLLALGGLAFGLLLAAGGVGIGGLAFGGVAVGFVAIGGLAIGKVAIGGLAIGTVAVSESPIGTYTHDVSTQGPITWEILKGLIREAYWTLRK